MNARSSRTARLRWTLIAIILLAFGLRLYRLGTDSLWYDETVSVHLAGKSLPDLVAHTAGDIHPPGYYLLLQAWTRLAGSSEFAAAFPSVVFGLLLVVLAYWTGKRVFGERAGLLAAFLVAISPYNLWYSQEVRMYTLGAALGMGVLGCVLLGLGPPSRRRGELGWLAGYALLAALGLWSLYYFAFLLVAINVMVGLWWLVAARRRAGWAWLGRWALAQGAVLLLYAPWIPIAWRQATDPPVPPWRGFTGLGQVLAESWSALCLGQSVEPAQVWPALLLFAGLFGLGLLSKRLSPRLGGREAGAGLWPWLLGGTTWLPLLLIYLASLVTPLYHVRYLFTYSTPFYVILGAGLSWLWRRWRPVAWLSLAVIVIFSGFSITAYHADARYARDDHRAAAEFLAERWRPGDAIVVNAGYAYPALLTYWDGEELAWRGRLVALDGLEGEGAGLVGPVVVQTGTVDGDPGLGWGEATSDFYAMPWPEAAASLEQLFATFDRVWVYRVYDTVTDPEGRIRGWLEEHGTPFEDRLFSGEASLRVQGYLTGRDPLAGMDGIGGEGVAGEEGGALYLEGSTALPAGVEVGEALDLALAWRVVEAPNGGDPDPGRAWILFAGLYDETGRRWAQVDERGLGSLMPASAWPEGALVRTPLRLEVPAGTPPGRYQVEAGWYRFVDGQPVWLPWSGSGSGGSPAQRILLGSVEVLAAGDWWALAVPEMAYRAGVTVGRDITLLGFDAPALAGYPGQDLELALVWQALADRPEAGLVVLQVRDDRGQVLWEQAAAPAEGRASFAQMEAGQIVRDAQRLALPGQLGPGVYSVVVGRRRADGSWLEVARGPVKLGPTYPLATIRVEGRAVNSTTPSVAHPLSARFGDGIELVGYDLEAGGEEVAVSLFWRARAPMETRYKVFLHLVAAGEPGEAGPEGGRVLAQADFYPRLPTTSWLPGEFLSDTVRLELPADLPAGGTRLLLGWYDEATGARLAVVDAEGQPLGDSLAVELVAAE